MTTRFFFICKFLCVPLFISAQAIFDIPDSLYEAGNFRQASIEYERSVFMADNYQNKGIARYRKALCEKQMHEFRKAFDILTSISFISMPDTLKENIIHERVLCGYLAGYFKEAESDLILYENKIKDKKIRKEISLLAVLIANELNDYQGADSLGEIYVNQYAPVEKKDSLLQVMEGIYNNKNLPKLKNTRTAWWLSFVPGLGHAYAGKIGEGMLSFLVNASFLAFGAYEVYTGYYLTGYLVGAGGLSKFYFGNRERVNYLINKRNYMETRSFNNKAKKIFLQTAEEFD